jgi:hypothetical protein
MLLSVGRHVDWRSVPACYSSILIGFPFGVLLIFLANMCFEPPSQQPLALYGTTTDNWSDEKYMTHQVV